MEKIDIDEVSARADEFTPMMRQYFEAKKAHPDVLLFFRMGDFFELFFEDAQFVAPTLNIALTSRGKHLEKNIPMCGIPVASINYYLAKLVKLGCKVAICDQLETPEDAKKRGYKAIVNRGITKIVTPGTVIDETFLSSKEDNYLMSIVPAKKTKTSQGMISFAIADISTDKFYTNTIVASDFLNLLEQYSPKEVLLPASCEQSDWFKQVKLSINAHITVLADSKFNPITEEKRLKSYYQVVTLESFGLSAPSEISACGAIVEYVSVTQCTNARQISKPLKLSKTNVMIIDSATHRNLEITHSANDNKNSLFYCIDRTVTSFGGRMLGTRIVSPTTDINEINDRLSSVEFFIKHPDLMNKLRAILSECPDIERAVVRIRFGKYSPRDLGAIRQGLYVIIRVINELKVLDFQLENKFSINDIYDFSELSDTLNIALVDELPVQYKEGAVIRSGYSEELDSIKKIVSGGHDIIYNLQAKYSSMYAINTLKIRNNNILGWYIEIPLSQKSKVGPEFIHKQTLVNNVRYVTNELQDLQIKLANASSDLMKVENAVISEIASKILDHTTQLELSIRFLAILDVALSMSHIATERKYAKPELTNDNILNIEQGRHPVLELIVDDFISNDCDLNADARLSILTGPNMAGKSTYLRQNALIVLLAHMGSYVPAKKATVGITDRLFSRIGASDDLAKGRSTFMVEMIETASILNQATEKSFVILDEVGRGTSTYDGISIAWAVVDHLCKINRCRTIFATHYMELTSMRDSIPQLKCQTLKVQEWNGKVLFCHSIVDGIADKSYGVYVAKLAGLPDAVVNKANSLLKKLERNSLNQAIRIGEQLSIFTSSLSNEPQYQEPTSEYSKVIKKISDVNLDEITPKEALNYLYQLKTQISDIDKSTI